LFENLFLGRAADGDGEGKIFLNGSRRFRNDDGRRWRCFAGRVIERKPGLGGVWSELSAPRAISIEALGKFAPPGRALLGRVRDDRSVLGTMDPRAAEIRVYSEFFPR
jgi:hypothetical protein